MHSSFACTIFSHFPFPVFSFHGLFVQLQAESSLKFGLWLLLFSVSARALIISVHLLYKQCREITQSQMFKGQMFKSCDRISLGWERSSVAIVQSEQAIQIVVVLQFVTIVQSEWTTEAAAIMWFVMRCILVLFGVWSPIFLCNQAVLSCDLYFKREENESPTLEMIVTGLWGVQVSGDEVQNRGESGAGREEGRKNGKMEMNESCKGSSELNWCKSRQTGWVRQNWESLNTLNMES